MNAPTICISFIVAIFGIAYPILLQVVSNLDEKYSSIVILELFNTEKIRKRFTLFLKLSLILILIYVLKIPNPFDFGLLNPLVDNSAIILLVSSSILLIVIFFYFVCKILIYYTPKQFLKYLIKEYNKHKKDIHFKAISDILIFAIKKENETIAQSISDFMYLVFKSHRENHEEHRIEYPACYYEVVYRATEELANLKNKKFTFLEYRTAGGLWLLGNWGSHKISETTYTWMWRNLLLGVKYERDEFILHYWKNANQYYLYQFGGIIPEYLSEHSSKIANENEIQIRDEERQRFLEFNYALGGMLYYRERYSCINRIFNYTMSIPPKYELLPEKMSEIIQWYIHFREPYPTKSRMSLNVFQFPDTEGINAESIAQNWIVKYIGVLFIRLYSIHRYLVTTNPLELPEPPKTQSEKNTHIEHIEYFQSIVKNIIKNKKLFKHLKLEKTSKKNLTKQNKPTPEDLLDSYKGKIREKFEITKIEQTISQIKVKKFNESAKKFISKQIEPYNSINNQCSITENSRSWFTWGIRTIVDKTAFVDDQETSFLNYDTIFAEQLTRNFMLGISTSFYYVQTQTYLLKRNQIFQAIDKMNINADYIIINFGDNIEWYIRQYDINGLSSNSYKGIRILNFAVSTPELVDRAFFVLRKDELPNINHLEIDEDKQKKFSLDLLDKKNRLYSSIIDLNNNNQIREELAASHSDINLRKHVLLTLLMKAEIRWKKNVNCTMLKVFSEHREKGIPDNIKAIKPIK